MTYSYGFIISDTFIFYHVIIGLLFGGIFSILSDFTLVIIPDLFEIYDLKNIFFSFILVNSLGMILGGIMFGIYAYIYRKLVNYM